MQERGAKQQQCQCASQRVGKDAAACNATSLGVRGERRLVGTHKRAATKGLGMQESGGKRGVATVARCCRDEVRARTRTTVRQSL